MYKGFNVNKVLHSGHLLYNRLLSKIGVLGLTKFSTHASF